MPKPQAAVGWDQGLAERQRGEPDRDVDEEDPVPAERLGQCAACEQAERSAGDRHEHVRAHRTGAISGHGELGDDDREDHRRLERRTNALQEASPDQETLGRRDAAQHRRDGEDDQAEQEHALTTEEIAEPSRQQQEAAERDQERVDDPGEVPLGEVEIVLDRRKRDVHDRRIEHDHQLRQADDRERHPAPAVGVGGER